VLVLSETAVDPLLTMERFRQSVATHGNGFGFILRFLTVLDLRPVATGRNHGAP